MTNKAKLEDRIVAELSKDGAGGTSSLWNMANLLYDNCMHEKRPGNGGRIAAIRKAAEKSDRLLYWVSSRNDEPHVSLNR